MNPKRRHQEINDQIAAAKVMPGGPNQDRPAAPVETPESVAAKIMEPLRPTPRGGKP